MPDRERVIEGLMCCQYSSKSHCDGCPYYYEGSCETNDCTADLASDALDLLKEQEPKFVPDIAEAIIGYKPKVKVGHCPSCGVLIHETDKFCRKCGQEVKWK